jgi:hypothetical protein
MTESINSPAPPEKPSANECCGSGCVPCIYDYYYQRLEEWERAHETTLEDYLKIEAAARDSDQTK